jgi:hypothetical protein
LLPDRFDLENGKEVLFKCGLPVLAITVAFNCTQGSNLGGKPGMITVEQFEQACVSLRGYFGVVGMFGGNPAMHPEFAALCEVMKKHIPREQRGLWCNNPITEENARTMRHTFNPSVSNLNCHLNREAYRLFKTCWPESMPFGIDRDSRHAPVHLAMKDVIEDEGKRWELISDCDINKHWSALIGVFRGQVRAWFCEVAGAQAMLHQDDPDYPDTGYDPVRRVRDGMTGKESLWWQMPMGAFRNQVKKHCHECGVPLRGYGELAMAELGTEQTSKTHADIYKPKRRGTNVELVETLEQLGTSRVGRVIDYLANGKK